MERIDIPLDKLNELYVEQKLSMRDTASILGVSSHVIRRSLHEAGIEIRSPYSYTSKWGKVFTREFLLIEYVEKKRHEKDIADEFGASLCTVSRYIRLHGIERNPRAKRPRGRHRWKSSDGYIMVYALGHPMSDSRGQALEHRKIYHDVHGGIPEGCEIHHLNGIKDDNRVENLIALSGSAHRNVIPALQERVSNLEKRLDRFEPRRATVGERTDFTKLLKGKYGEHICLELGPGRKGARDGFASIGLNESADPGCDIYWDLNRGLPLEDEALSIITSNQTLEHIRRRNFIPFMNDCWRTLKPGGAFEACVPHYESPYADGDPTHYNKFSEVSFRYFCQKPDGTPFVDEFSDYGIECNFIIIRNKARRKVDVTVELRKPRSKE